MRNDCYKRIEELRVALCDEVSAYTYRSRLGRLVVSCLNYISKEQQLTELSFPVFIDVSMYSDSDLRSLVNTCNKIWELGKKLSQPSEPFDEKWTKNKEALLNLLNELEENFGCRD